MPTYATSYYDATIYGGNAKIRCKRAVTFSKKKCRVNADRILRFSGRYRKMGELNETWALSQISRALCACDRLSIF